jgi:hypothetical protein
METTMSRRVTIIPVRSPLSCGMTNPIQEMRTNMAEGWGRFDESVSAVIYGKFTVSKM